MSEQDFTLAVKSTIDKVGYDMAQAESPALNFVDLTDTVNTTKLIKSNDDAFIWELAMLDAHPKDPLYAAQFSIGARTVTDPGNYNILGLVGKLKELFNVGSTLAVHNYTGATAGPKVGVITVTDVSVMPQQYDQIAGIRMVSLQARVLRLG